MRTILHCDCNSFFASVESMYNPELKNIPMAVGGSEESRKGIILAKNEAAKKYGVVTAETIWSAKKKCPQLVVVSPHYDRYVAVSEKVNEIYKEYSEFVEPFGIDESWIDVTDVKELFGDGKTIADTIRKRVREEIGITVSVGVSFTKSFAKLGSDYKKPDATTVIDRDDVETIVYPQNLNCLLFAGEKICAEFNKYGIVTIGDLARCDKSFIEKHFGKNGMLLYNYAKGNDEDKVHSVYDKEEIKSVGNSYTFPYDLTDKDDISHAFTWLSDVVSGRMRKLKVRCSVVGITIKDENFKTINRQMTISNPTNHRKDLKKYAMDLFLEVWKGNNGIRLLGITGSNLIRDGEEQTSLFSFGEDEKKEKLETAIDSIREKFGTNAVKIASSDKFNSKYASDDKENN
ncbi:MAG: DNA polymerase IV [Clostridia bacterium]